MWGPSTIPFSSDLGGGAHKSLLFTCKVNGIFLGSSPEDGGVLVVVVVVVFYTKCGPVYGLVT